MYVLDGQSSPKTSPSDTEQASNRNSVKAPPASSLKRLRSSCVVVRVDDMDIHQASFNHQLIQFTCFNRFTSVNGPRDFSSSDEAVKLYLTRIALHLEAKNLAVTKHNGFGLIYNLL